MKFVYVLAMTAMAGCASQHPVPKFSDLADLQPRGILEAESDEAHISVPPKGFNDFCARHPDYCAGFASARAVSIELTPEIYDQIAATNIRANRSILPLDEGKVKDYWKFPEVTGDCEDYCLLKQRELAEAGVPMGAMPLAAVRTPRGEWHAVLLVHTDRGTLVLDNKSDAALFHDQTGYDYVFVQRPDDMMRWTRFAMDTDNSTSKVVTSSN